MKRRVKNWVHLHNQVTALQDMMPDRMERETLWLSPVMATNIYPISVRACHSTIRTGRLFAQCLNLG